MVSLQQAQDTPKYPQAEPQHMNFHQMPVSSNQPSVSTMPQQVLHHQQQFIPTSIHFILHQELRRNT
jgi:hypothetical protein